MDEMKDKIRNCCLEKEAAPCVSSCPFHLDIREFIPRLERKAFNLAYRLYANSVAFPRIVAEICDESCKKVCPRKEIGGAINLSMLEKAAVTYADRTDPSSFNLPPKGKKVAVIGAGISSLACALRLANKKYDVTVYEKEDKIGGHLWKLISPDIFMKDIEEQFSKEQYTLLLNTEIKNIDDIINKYDAVYVATGQNGETFGLVADISNINDVKALDKGIFIGGSLLGASSVEAIAHGLKAALLIEGYIKTENMKDPEEYIHTKIKLDLKDVAPIPSLLPSVNGTYSENEAAEEAARCLKCRCDNCMRSCEMMQYFQKFPKLIEEEVHITINPGTLDGNGTVATRLISTCNQCGLCKEVCPEDIDVGIFMRESHRAMREKNAMPWAFHEFWLNDMNFSRSDRASFFYAPETKDRCRYIFFPGCQMGASDPQYVAKSYRLLREHMPDTALLLDCCGAPALWSGDAGLFDEICKDITDKWTKLGMPVFIFGCPTCRELMNEHIPKIKGKMIGDTFYELGVKAKDGKGMEISVFDPCSARKLHDTHQNVRNMLTEAGFVLRPLEYERERAKCCSWGGQISIANPPYTRWLTEKRTSENIYPYLVYCTNCRDIFAEAGKQPVLHILDVILGMVDRNRKPPTYSKRRRNRELLKEALMEELLGKKATKEKRPQLFMSKEIGEKLHKEKILEDDIIDVIDFCERTGRKILIPELDHFIGYCEIGHMTCWAEYSPENGGYRIHNAYSHRMKIELEEVWHGRKQKVDM